MLKFLREIVLEYRGDQGGWSNPRGRGGRDNNRVNHCTPDDANFNCGITNEYCHMYRGCNYEGKDCTHKAPSHKDSAMMSNRKGGSNDFCEWRGETKEDIHILDKLNNLFTTINCQLSTSVVSPKPTQSIQAESIRKDCLSSMKLNNQSQLLKKYLSLMKQLLLKEIVPQVTTTGRKKTKPSF